MARPNNRAKWPSAQLLTRAVHVDEAGPVRFVDTEAAAKYLALDAHTLECYRSLDSGPAFYKFGRYVRYAVSDLDQVRRALEAEGIVFINSGPHIGVMVDVSQLDTQK